MILSATGHRPDKLGGYGNDVLDRLTDLACKHLVRFEPELTVISGLAQGWDTAVALAAIQLGGIKLFGVVPFPEFGRSPWPSTAQQRYQFILSKAESVFVTCDGEYAAWKMQKRNTWMVDHANKVLALWDGSAGGTMNCVAYAKRKNKPVVNLWSEWKS